MVDRDKQNVWEVMMLFPALFASTDHISVKTSAVASS